MHEHKCIRKNALQEFLEFRAVFSISVAKIAILLTASVWMTIKLLLAARMANGENIPYRKVCENMEHSRKSVVVKSVRDSHE